MNIVLIAAEMSLLARIVSVAFIIAQYFVDGPMPPTLDFMLRIFGFRMVPAGIEEVWPLLLAPPEDVPFWIFEWLSIWNNPVLGGLIVSLTSWAVMKFYGWTDSIGGRANGSHAMKLSPKSNPCPEDMPFSSGTNVICQNRHLMDLRSQCTGIHDSLMRVGSTSEDFQDF